MKDKKIDPFTGAAVDATPFTEWMSEVGLPVIREDGEKFLSNVDNLMWLAYRRGLYEGGGGDGAD